MKPQLNKLAKGFLVRAEADLLVAGNEIKLFEDGTATEMICFHAQQAVEKYLKALITSKDISVPRTHSIEYLLEVCSDFDADFKNIEADNLSIYAVEVRYPDSLWIPEAEEAKLAVDKAREIKKIVLEKLKLTNEDISKIRVEIINSSA